MCPLRWCQNVGNSGSCFPKPHTKPFAGWLRGENRTKRGRIYRISYDRMFIDSLFILSCQRTMSFDITSGERPTLKQTQETLKCLFFLYCVCVCVCVWPLALVPFVQLYVALCPALRVPVKNAHKLTRALGLRDAIKLRCSHGRQEGNRRSSSSRNPPDGWGEVEVLNLLLSVMRYNAEQLHPKCSIDHLYERVHIHTVYRYVHLSHSIHMHNSIYFEFDVGD